MAVMAMAAACATIWLAVVMISPAHASSVFFGMFGPFAAVAGTWLLAERVTRAEIVLYDVLNEALMRLAPGPWPEEGPVTVDAVAFGDLAEEIQLRMLDRLIGWTGNEGPVELGKLEALCSALEGPLIDALMEPKRGSFRRTLAGAMITLSGTKLTVERAPPRRTGMKKRRSG